jgi:hypothetical protein
MSDTPHPAIVAAGATVAALARIEALLYEALRTQTEEESDFDQTFIVGGFLAAGGAVLPIALPRTLRHVELTLSLQTASPTNVVACAVLPGNLSLAQANGQHNVIGQGTSNAIVTSVAGGVTARDFLDQSGWLTVYVDLTAGGTAFANVRIRSLDSTQSRREVT